MAYIRFLQSNHESDIISLALMREGLSIALKMAGLLTARLKLKLGVDGTADQCRVALVENYPRLRFSKVFWEHCKAKHCKLANHGGWNVKKKQCPWFKTGSRLQIKHCIVDGFSTSGYLGHILVVNFR